MTLRPLLFIPLLVLMSGCQGQYAANGPPARMFDTQAEAQRHCPHDVVVWADRSTGTYHMPNEPLYGRAFHGAFLDRGFYTCKAEADRSPYMRPGHNLRS